MVKEYVIRIFQMLIATAFTLAFYMSYVDYFNVDHQDYTTFSGDYDVRVQVGRPSQAITKSKGDNTLLVSATEDLELVETNKLANEVFGNTLLEAPKNSYVNNFEEVVVTNQYNQSTSYYTELDQYALNIIYSYPIEVVYAFENNNVYHSLSSIYIESTIGHKVKSSVITQISKGKRVDIVVDKPIEQIAYDSENDTYYLFYIPITSEYAYEVISQVEYITIGKNEEGQYAVDYTVRKAGFSATYGKIEAVSSMVGGKFLISYSKNVSYGEINQIHYYLGTFDVSKGVLENERVLLQKENELESDIVVVDSLQIGEHLYVFYDDLTYFKFNVYDGSYENFIITNTGVINEFQFSSDGENIFLLTLGDKVFTLFELHDGIVQDSVTMSRRNLGLGVIDFNRLYDFTIKPVEE